MNAFNLPADIWWTIKRFVLLNFVKIKFDKKIQRGVYGNSKFDDIILDIDRFILFDAKGQLVELLVKNSRRDFQLVGVIAQKRFMANYLSNMDVKQFRIYGCRHTSFIANCKDDPITKTTMIKLKKIKDNPAMEEKEILLWELYHDSDIYEDVPQLLEFVFLHTPMSVKEILEDMNKNYKISSPLLYKFFLFKLLAQLTCIYDIDGVKLVFEQLKSIGWDMKKYKILDEPNDDYFFLMVTKEFEDRSLVSLAYSEDKPKLEIEKIPGTIFRWVSVPYELVNGPRLFAIKEILTQKDLCIDENTKELSLCDEVPTTFFYIKEQRLFTTTKHTTTEPVLEGTVSLIQYLIQ
jgi:hypothetical protein